MKNSKPAMNGQDIRALQEMAQALVAIKGGRLRERGTRQLPSSVRCQELSGDVWRDREPGVFVL